jgi:gamma-glutamyltranspeptidase/glutathione hydrolase
MSSLSGASSVDTSFTDDDENGADSRKTRKRSVPAQRPVSSAIPARRAGGRAAAHRGWSYDSTRATADLIVGVMKRSGGIISHEDDLPIPGARRTPLEFTYRGHPVVSMPPVPSGGLTLALILDTERSNIDR